MKNKWIYIVAGVLVVAIIVVIAVVSSNRNKTEDVPTVSNEVNEVLDGVDQKDEPSGEDPDLVADENLNPEDGQEPEPSNPTTPNTNSSAPTTTTTPSTATTTKKSETGSFVASDGTKFEIALVEDVLEEDVLIKWAKVRFSEYVPEAKVKSAAEKVVEHLTSITDVNGIGIDCYYTQDVSGIYNVARVIWAPYGDWNQTASVKAGDYGANDYLVMMVAEPEPLPDKVAGISYENAKKAYAKYFGSQDKIKADAEKKYPDDAIAKQTYISEQNNKLINEIYNEYGMKSDAIADLILAGLKYNWTY